MVFSFLLGIFLISFTSAAINVSIGSTSAADSGTSTAATGGSGSGTNYSNSSSLVSQIPMVTFNVTLINNTDILYNVTAGGFLTPQGLNASFYLVTEGVKTWTLIGRSLNCTPYGTAPQTRASCWMNISTGLGNFNISTGRYNITAVVSTAENIAGKNSTFNVTMVVFDHDAPFNVNITGVSNGQNHSTRSNSGNLTLNVSIADLFQGLNASSGIQSVIFNIINSSSHTNRTLTALREGTTQYWSTSINTSEFINGKYNITVAVNDTAGNFNSTANSSTTPPIFSLIFDNSLPSVSFSCTPTQVNTGDTVTCSCSGSATSGINSTSYTEKPSTSNTGTFTETCSATSKSGISNSATAQYTVEQSGGGSSGGGSSGSGGGDDSGDSSEDSGGDDDSSETTWSQTVSQDDTELSEKGAITQTLEATQRVSVKISGETHYVGVKSLTATSATIEVSSTPQEVTLNVGESKKFDTTDDGYYDLEVRLASIEETKANVIIKPIYEKVETTEGGEESVISSSILWWIIIVVALIVIVGAIIYYKKKR